MEIGWNLVIETTNGIVGLWTCWLGDSFRLGYPLDLEIPDQMIMDTLGVTYAEAVKTKSSGTRKMAKYYSPRLENNQRVWIDQDRNCMYSDDLYKIQNQKLRKHYIGYYYTNTISVYTFGYTEGNPLPDTPNCEKHNIQAYKDKFIELAVKIAKELGDIIGLNIDSGQILYTPETLVEKGYSLTKWATPSTQFCYTKDDEKEIVLMSCNSIIPWRTIIRYPASNNLTSKEIIKLLDSYDNSEYPADFVPLIVEYARLEQIYNDYHK